MAIDDIIPQTNLGNCKTPFESKMVQVYVNGHAYLRIGAGFHADILHRFLKEFIEAGEPLIPPSMMCSEPPRQTETYDAVGMGKLRVDPSKKVIEFGGISSGYMIPADEYHMEKIADSLPEWEFVFRGNVL